MPPRSTKPDLNAAVVRQRGGNFENRPGLDHQGLGRAPSSGPVGNYGEFFLSGAAMSVPNSKSSPCAARHRNLW